MELLTNIFQQKKKTFSFELFPPKTEEGFQKLLKNIEKLSSLDPDFISVTYGAGGGNRSRTLDVVEYIQKEHQIPGLSHLTCVIHTKQEVARIIQDIQSRGIRNILALRGDPPQDQPDWQPSDQNFRYSYELCHFIRKTHADYFSIGVAGFPEGHISCPDKEQDAQYLKMKVDSGADFVLTQLFFDNNAYWDYIARLEKLGVKTRIIPGIFPITDYKGIVRFCGICGAKIPQKIHDIFKPIENDKNALLKEGIRFCVEQCKELLDNGAPGIHFFPLNKVHPIDEILPQIRD